MITRNEMAKELFINVMKKAENLGVSSKEERRELFVLVAEISFEMADAFLNVEKSEKSNT